MDEYAAHALLMMVMMLIVIVANTAARLLVNDRQAQLVNGVSFVIAVIAFVAWVVYSLVL